MACGMALDMGPWLNEPSRRRFPFIFKYRAAQIVGLATSQEKIVSSEAIVDAFYSRCDQSCDNNLCYGYHVSLLFNMLVSFLNEVHFLGCLREPVPELGMRQGDQR
jgi:hypothetical protein